MTRTPATSSSTSRRQSSTTTINRSHHHDPLNSDIHPRPTGQDGCRYRPCCLTPSTVLSPQPDELLALCRGQPAVAPTRVAIGLLDPLPDRPGRAAELLRQLVKAAPGPV